ncbi:hypothetical protein J437_LFUL019187 [Ladona fulva]|uniref:thioredoxin-dependent peroxiredoxin n=1 Tax=Ladona fulva TaxID=123851 RepID=A0A8K0KEW0_LADFU|nr:hypothetical protein J437_LFUL019187 [Ladona fulva]
MHDLFETWVFRNCRNLPHTSRVQLWSMGLLKILSSQTTKGNITFVCPTEIIAFSDNAEKFKNINCEVIGASCDSHFCHLAWIEKPRKQGGLGEMKIPLLADKTGNIARDYGIYDEKTGVPFRGLFIIDRNQNLRQITINDLPVGRSVDETLRLVQAFQYTDEHGEVCPANWKPGAKTMVPSPHDSKEYFKSQH